MTFEDWCETYERDGGELMLFNAIDLRSAWDARQSEIDALKAEVSKYREALEKIATLRGDHNIMTTPSIAKQALEVSPRRSVKRKQNG